MSLAALDAPIPRPSQLEFHQLRIVDIHPSVDEGRRFAKATQGEPLPISAIIFSEGQPTLRARVHWRSCGSERWGTAPMALHPVTDNLFEGLVTFDALGPGEFSIEAWEDRFGSWRLGFLNWQRAGVDLSSEVASGAAILRGLLHLLPEADRERLTDALHAAHDSEPRLQRLLLRPELAKLMASVPSQHPLQSATFPIWTERRLAACGAWYEFFPRSEGSHGHRPGNFRTAAERLPAVAAMGFDVVYLPPIHPIGTSGRKGKNGTAPAGPHDPGSPWAIGAPAGGHTAIHPDLGTEADLRGFLARARELGLEVALDYTLQCSPDHPWVTEHPDWFLHRPDGSIRAAENPPKRYDDVYPLDFLCADRDGLWEASYQILEHWIAQGVELFRVDNPHTKPLPFWDWVFRRLRRDHPRVVMLAEAFTTPALQYELSKLGFSQSYTFFTWRTSKRAITEYMEELTGSTADFFRPNFFVNTPDILSKELVKGGPNAFRSRLLLAATLSPSYGVYSGYELYEREPQSPSNEEYLNSEKFEYRSRDWGTEGSLIPLIGDLNRIRRERPSLRQLRGTRFHKVGNPWVICYSRHTPDLEDLLLVMINLDPRRPHEAVVHLDLRELEITRGKTFGVRDLLSDFSASWKGPRQRVRLGTGEEMAHILAVDR